MINIALMLLIAAGPALPANPIIVVGELQPEVTSSYLKEACEFAGGECPDIPRVLYALTPSNIWGFHYRGSSLVFMTSRCTVGGVFCEGILVHELVHYVVSEQGRYEGMPCANEQLAWAAYNSYVIRRGKPELVNLDWRKAYKRCRSSD